MGKYQVPILPSIVINYFVALAIGISLFDEPVSFAYIVNSKWFGLSIFIGSLLIAGLYLIGYSTQKAGIAVTTIANKMSVIIPISFSIFYYSESVNLYKLIGIILALAAVLMAVYREKEIERKPAAILVPLLMFLLVGIIDSSLKLAEQDFVETKDIPLFTAFGFGLAGLIGVILLAFKPSQFTYYSKPVVWVFGVAIGVVNYGTMYFLMLSLDQSGWDGSIVYGVNNIGIILLSIVIAFAFFKEKLSKINLLGIVLAILAAAMLTMLA